MSARGPAYGLVVVMAQETNGEAGTPRCRPQRRSGGAVGCGRAARRRAGRGAGGRSGGPARPGAAGARYRLGLRGLRAGLVARAVLGSGGVALGVGALGVALGVRLGGWLLPAVGAVEAGALEDDADGVEDLPQPGAA